MDSLRKQRAIVLIINGVTFIGVEATVWIDMTIATKILVTVVLLALMVTGTAYQFHLIEEERQRAAKEAARDKIHSWRHREIIAKLEGNDTRGALEDIRVQLRKGNDEIIHSGTLQIRAELLAAEMFRFVSRASHYAMLMKGKYIFRSQTGPDGEITFTLPNTDYETQVAESFGEEFEKRAKTIIGEMRERGIEDERLNHFFSTYRDGYWQMTALSDRLMEVAWSLKP